MELFSAGRIPNLLSEVTAGQLDFPTAAVGGTISTWRATAPVISDHQGPRGENQNRNPRYEQKTQTKLPDPRLVLATRVQIPPRGGATEVQSSKRTERRRDGRRRYPPCDRCTHA
ncbi:hypothetical protein NHX12_014447 [Muraenolepis orangiensis]|uniref:Uncharacterized protein n=1 Tax=Muraenolepis orangiensis TaxID=630683 RepID=A0A9Q0DBZ9_9TELE|nr:hypothetical protein NHX12_014447 [Muraenolepis orangiensis]